MKAIVAVLKLRSKPLCGRLLFAHLVYAARHLERYTQAPGRSEDGYALDKKQASFEESATELIQADVLHRMSQAEDWARARALREGQVPKVADLHYFAAHVGGVIEVRSPGDDAVHNAKRFGSGELKLILELGFL